MAVWRGRAKGGQRGAAPTVTDTSAPATSAMLDVRDLKIYFPTDDGLVKAVDGVSFTLDRGKTLGIVGESGSGKSVTSLGITMLAAFFIIIANLGVDILYAVVDPRVRH